MNWPNQPRGYRNADSTAICAWMMDRRSTKIVEERENGDPQIHTLSGEESLASLIREPYTRWSLQCVGPDDLPPYLSQSLFVKLRWTSWDHAIGVPQPHFGIIMGCIRLGKPGEMDQHATWAGPTYISGWRTQCFDASPQFPVLYSPHRLHRRTFLYPTHTSMDAPIPKQTKSNEG